MWFWRTPLGGLTGVVLLTLALVVVSTAVAVDRVTTPPRRAQETPDFEAMQIRVEEVRFPSPDGIELSGWWFAGSPDKPALVLCHDLGASKREMLNLAIAMHEAGFPVFAFDFRGHGDSGQRRSSLGLLEKRDLLGALDWVEQRRPGAVGVFGVGMGAHAAVLAAAERSQLRALVLDGVYPDSAFPLGRGVFPRSAWARRGLGFLTNWAYFAVHGVSARSQRAADRVEALRGTHVLMLAPASDSELIDAMRAMVQRIPEQIDADGNLVVIPVTLSQGLYGEQLDRYDARVTGFFEARLLPRAGRPVAD